MSSISKFRIVHGDVSGGGQDPRRGRLHRLLVASATDASGRAFLRDENWVSVRKSQSTAHLRTDLSRNLATIGPFRGMEGQIHPIYLLKGFSYRKIEPWS